MTGATTVYQHRRQADPQLRYSRFELPAFDAWVYMAMAEQPRVFTLAPWGYRVLTPWTVAALPVRSLPRAFRYVSLGALIAAGLLLYAWLCRLGHSPPLALAALVGFGLSPPVAEVTGHVFLADPLTFLLFAAFLLALESGAGAGPMALLLLLGALSKELALLLAPAVLLRDWRDGPRRALVRSGLVAAPALLALVGLRALWAPHLASGLPPLDPAWALAALLRLAAAWREWLPPLLLLGLTPLAVAGSLRRGSRPFLARYGYLALATLLLPLAASVWGGDAGAVHVFASDVRRLSLYALPVLLSLALRALWPPAAVGPVAAPSRSAPRLSLAAGVACLAALLALPWFLDDYRRAELGGQRDGPFVLGLVRETARAARRLESGEAIRLDPARDGFAWGESDPGRLDRLRWYLAEGWGAHPHYGTGRVRLLAPRGSLRLPLLTPQPLQLSLELRAAQPRAVSLFVNGRPLGRVRAGPEAAPSLVELPAEALFRGDNVLVLVPEGAPGELSLEGYGWRPMLARESRFELS